MAEIARRLYKQDRATGLCYGGGIANTLAMPLGADFAAAASFYGVVPPKDEVPKIKAAILAHHGELDMRYRGLPCEIGRGFVIPSGVPSQAMDDAG